MSNQINSNMNINLDKLYSETEEDWAEKYLETYLLLFGNAAGKRTEARKYILANDETLMWR